MVTAGVFLLIRSSPLLEMSHQALFLITILGALTAFFAASIAVVQNDLKKVIAYSTASQLGYMVFACGLSNYSVSLFHLINHGFFGRQHRYFNLKDGFSFRDSFQDIKLTYFLSKLEKIWNKKGERKWILVKTPLSWFNISTLYGKILQEKSIKKLHLRSWWGIESTWFLLIQFVYYWITIKILKVGKPVKIFFLLIWLFLFGEIKIKFLIQSGCRIVTKLIALSNFKDRFLWIISWESWIDYSCWIILILYNNFSPQFLIYTKKDYRFNSLLYYYSKDSQLSYSKNLIVFKKELKYIFKFYNNFSLLIPNILKILIKYVPLLGYSYKNRRLMDNIIHKNCWLWVKKKHPKINKKNLYNKYFSGNGFNRLKSQNFYNKKIYTHIYISNRNFLTPSPDLSNSFLSIWDNQPILDEMLWSNIDKNIEIIKNKLKGKSGIYIFWLTNNKQNCYVGSGLDLLRRFKVHYKNALINNKHPKFYNAVKYYGWSNFSLQILELIDPLSTNIELLKENQKKIIRSNILIREQYWLSLLKQSNYWNNSFNVLEKTNSWEGYKHLEKSKYKISQQKLNHSLTSEHIKNISLEKREPLHHLYGKPRSPETIEKIN